VSGAERRRILVVDDERTLVETIRERFAARFDVETVSSRSGALAALAARRPDVVLLDVDLPEASGLDVLRELRTVDTEVPVIMVAASARNADAVAALELGAVGYLPKPFDFRYLEHLNAASLTGR
jgi:DNA-binding response OmpR family regulator